MLGDTEYDTHENDDELDIILENPQSSKGVYMKEQESELYFDAIIGHIEDLIMEEDFQKVQNNFLEKHWTKFEDLDENKFIYMDIFHEYVETIERYIDSYLTKRIQGFNMEEFLKMLEEKCKNNDVNEELESEIFELLLTFTDFLRFKQMFLDYRANKEGKFRDFQSDIKVISLSSQQN